MGGNDEGVVIQFDHQVVNESPAEFLEMQQTWMQETDECRDFNEFLIHH